MNYDDIKLLALSYADREDQEVKDRMDNFIDIVESRVNRKLRVFNMTIRSAIPIVVDQELYDLPTDFGGLRDVQYVNGSSQALKYMSPEQLTNRKNVVTGRFPSEQIFYTLIAGQIQIFPTQKDGNIEIVYYQKLVPLTSTNTTNWLSDINPDCYVFGIVMEISSFAKDKEAAILWDGRFKECLQEIKDEDSVDRWSGTALEVRVG